MNDLLQQFSNDKMLIY